MKRSDTSVAEPATLFAALGDPARLRIVIRLSRSESLNIKELAAGAQITRQAVTKHLHVLASAGVATPSKLGREQRWSLDQKQLAQARQFLDRVTRQWDDALGRLKALVEESER